MTSTANQCRPPRYGTVTLYGVALLVAVVTGNVASIAQASCGDYVVIGNPTHQTMGQVQELNTASPMEHSLPLPCHGPGCQQGNAFPPLPVPTVITSSTELVAVPATNAAALVRSGSRVEVRAAGCIEGVSDRVERPPRFAA
jgi:hypothetical protein